MQHDVVLEPNKIELAQEKFEFAVKIADSTQTIKDISRYVTVIIGTREAEIKKLIDGEFYRTINEEEAVPCGQKGFKLPEEQNAALRADLY